MQTHYSFVKLVFCKRVELLLMHKFVISVFDCHFIYTILTVAHASALSLLQSQQDVQLEELRERIGRTDRELAKRYNKWKLIYSPTVIIHIIICAIK